MKACVTGASPPADMALTVDSAFNASAEVAAADAYPSIRIMSVSYPCNATTEQAELCDVQLPWARASTATVGMGNWSAFSATCWFAARDMYNGLGRTVPIGAVVTSYAGTPIQVRAEAVSLVSPNHLHVGARRSGGPALHTALVPLRACHLRLPQVWSSAAAVAECAAVRPPTPGMGIPCNTRGNVSCLWNGNIAPFAVGPLALSGVVWYQGEQVDSSIIHSSESRSEPFSPLQDTAYLAQLQEGYYTCALQALVAHWRLRFASPQLWFGVLVLQPWTWDIATLPLVRLSQARGRPWYWHPRQPALSTALSSTPLRRCPSQRRFPEW